MTSADTLHAYNEMIIYLKLFFSLWENEVSNEIRPPHQYKININGPDHRVNRRDETRQEHDLARLRQRNGQVSFIARLRSIDFGYRNNVLCTILAQCTDEVRAPGVSVYSWVKRAHFFRDNFICHCANVDRVRCLHREYFICSHVCKSAQWKNRVKMVEPIDCYYYY